MPLLHIEEMFETIFKVINADTIIKVLEKMRVARTSTFLHFPPEDFITTTYGLPVPLSLATQEDKAYAIHRAIFTAKLEK